MAWRLHMTDPSYAITHRLPGVSLAEAERRVRGALADEGFGIVSEIDMQATLLKKLGVQRRPYRILGACNPHFAKAALEIEPGLGVFLPCNVDVWEDADGATVLQAIRPDKLIALADNDALVPLAQAIQGKLERALRAAANG
jgi:uncharacterized protein (DUF302 family)